MAEGSSAQESALPINPIIPETKTSQETSRGSTPEAAVPKEAAEPTELWYHYTSPKDVESIKAIGLQGSSHGKLGPGVYISDKPMQLATPGRFEILTLRLQEKTDILEVSWGQGTNPHKIITDLYGKGSAKLLKEVAEISRPDARKGWEYLQKLAKTKGYDGFSWIDPMSGIKEVVIFDPKKLSLTESPATETVAQAAEAVAPNAEKLSAPEVTAVKPEQQNSRQRQAIRAYLNSGANRIAKTAEQLGPWLINPANRKIFIEEWTRAVASAKNLEQLASVTSLAMDPHQFGGISRHIESLIHAARPELKGKYIPEIANFPEYDGIRKAVGEKLKTLGLTNSGIVGTRSHIYHIGNIFHLLHPNPYEEYTYTTTKVETRGKIFKKPVRVPVEERGKRLRPYEQLMAELLQYNQPQSTPAVPKG